MIEDVDLLPSYYSYIKRIYVLDKYSKISLIITTVTDRSVTKKSI